MPTKRQVRFIATNILKMALWIFAIPASMKIFGALYGVLIYLAFAFVWNIALTLYRQRKNPDGFGRTFISIISHPILWLSVWGYYCGRKYGVDGWTNTQIPIDDLDLGCECHDTAMLAAEAKLKSKEITKAEFNKLKTHGDWQMMKSAIKAKTSASGLYLLGIQIGLGARILNRFIPK